MSIKYYSAALQSKNYYYYPILQLGKHPQELHDLPQVTYHRQRSQVFELRLSQTLQMFFFYFLQKLRVTVTWDIIAQGGTFMLWKKYPSWMSVVTSNSKYLQSYCRSHHLPTTMLCVEVGFCFCFLKSTSSSLCTILIDEGTLYLPRIRAPWELSWALGHFLCSILGGQSGWYQDAYQLDLTAGHSGCWDSSGAKLVVAEFCELM